MNHQQIAPTPPLGWNSWDCYGAAVTEEEIRGNAEYMAKHLKDFGWNYITVDIQWYEPGALSSQYRPFVPLVMDGYSRLMPAENRFPSAAGGQGFKPLADYVHSLGLRFGIHIMRGIPRQAVHAATPILGTTATARDIAHPNSICPWNTDMYGVDASKEGAQAYYDSLFALYASWGVDLVKVDDIAASRLYGTHQAEIALISEAIKRCGRPMVLSLSPGPAPVELAAFFAEHANMWRMTDDFWDQWPLLRDMFDRCRAWQGVPQAGSWPDCDMLPLGHIGIRSVDGGGADRWTRFTRDEQLTMMSLWSIFRSPLIFGGELRDNDEWTLSLLTNREVLRMHRESRGAKEALRQDDLIVWTAEHPEGFNYAAVFNVGESALPLELPLEQIGLSGISSGTELWSEAPAELTAAGELRTTIPPHGVRLYRLE
ncbi:Alpha-galactosidase [Paenibacillus barengoltzii]|uniref:glycoside hydrolase family 27 protein n=1 Tax=Paenibacillus barengoltzii TaxID=343517 RepID=UPI000A08AE4B|nr:glycoside hydrolase family 27 protein [Paenibacillus barengoltzii]SME88478.1 Alpha-galactosidase [Paenibacillus barengoltzii]